MAEGGDITSSLLSGLNSAIKSQPEIEISKEDAAWVDSCFVSDAEISDDAWNRVIDFLFDTQMISADDPVSVEEKEDEDPFDEGSSSPVSVKEEKEEDFDFHENIFKVWDLRTQVEDEEEEENENELIKQLNRALSESRTTVRPLSLYEPTIASDEEEEDELVAGLADLSLETSSE